MVDACTFCAEPPFPSFFNVALNSMIFDMGSRYWAAPANDAVRSGPLCSNPPAYPYLASNKKGTAPESLSHATSGASCPLL